MSRTSQYNYRHSDAGRSARRAYQQQPEVKAKNEIKRAIKAHRTPVMPKFMGPTPPRVPKVK